MHVGENFITRHTLVWKGTATVVVVFFVSAYRYISATVASIAYLPLSRTSNQCSKIVIVQKSVVTSQNMK